MVTRVLAPAGRSADTDTAVLTVSGLAAANQGSPLLTDIDLTVAAGECIGIAGESGAGKTTLIGCLSGEIVPSAGAVVFSSHGRDRAGRPSVGIVWQTAAECGNLDVASNLMLGAETRRMVRTGHELRTAAEQLLAELGFGSIGIDRPMATLSRSEEQLVAIARALRDRPALLLLDDPTFPLGARETAGVENLLTRVKAAGTAIILVSSDLHQLLRQSDRVVVLRRGRIVAQVDAGTTHPEDLAALMAGDEVATSSRRQLRRIQSLADRLTTASGVSSGLPLILSALAGALGAVTVCLHVLRDTTLTLAGSSGTPSDHANVLESVPMGSGPIGAAAARGATVTEADGPWATQRGLSGLCYAVPIMGSAGVLGAITVFDDAHRVASRDELDLVSLYAGYAATTIEREQLLDEITARNRMLETIRAALEALTGPGTFDDALAGALAAVREAVGADCIVLCEPHPEAPIIHWATASASGTCADADRLDSDPEMAVAAAAVAIAGRVNRNPSRTLVTGTTYHATSVDTPAGLGTLLVYRTRGLDRETPQDLDVLADTAHFLRLAFERQDAERARQEAGALRRTEMVQRQFFARLSHELRTPLTAIRGYASSLTQPDVQWDEASKHKFLARISDESGRLGRLVGDLLDFSSMEAGVLRLHRDWCEVPLILDAARACLPADDAARVTIEPTPGLPAIWADHDRLEQVFVNLLGNAIRHNPPSTRVMVRLAPSAAGVTVTVADDGIGLPPGETGDAHGAARATSGSGLGLSIMRGIVTAHGGTVQLLPTERGTTWRLDLPETAPTDDGPRTEGGDADL